MEQPAQVQEKTSRPQGLLPKNVQSWLLAGLAFLMIAIMWLTGGTKPQTPNKAAPSATPLEAPFQVNQAKITELQNRIVELQHQQLVAQNALVQQAHLLGAAADPEESSQTGRTGTGTPGQRPLDAIEAERRTRAYASLFASNIALSYRASPTTANGPVPSSPAPAPPASDLPQIAQILKDLQPNLNSRALASIANDSLEKKEESRQELQGHAASSTLAANAATGKIYVLFEGTILETVLINRLDGQFSGPVECLLSTDVYSNDRQHLLIPAGSKLLGETRKVDNFGQTRLAVVFHRILMPDGYSVSLDQFKGLDQIGDTGLRDQVNNHYLRIFGVSLAIGALGAVAEAGTAGALTASSGDLMRQGFAQSTAQSSAQILDKFLNLMPTVTIREGHRVKVFLAGDLALPAYNNHQMPSDL
jgi:type IV secretion system protein TrbI